MNQQRIDFLKKLKAHGIRENIPNVTERNGRFLHFLVKSMGAKSVLEIGMANGYSTIYLADAVEEVNGNVVCYEISEPGWREAEKNFSMVGLKNLIEVRKTNILREPPKISEQFDFIFVDGQKAHYHEFWKLVKKHMHEKTVVVFDDVLKFPEKTKKFHEVMKQETDFEKVILPIDEDDGVMLVRRN